MTESRYMPDQAGLIDLETLVSMSGMDVLQKILRGELPALPIGKTLGFTVTEVADGRAVVMSEPGVEHYNIIRTVHAGYTATLLDTCMACAVLTTLPQGTGFTTMEFKISLLRPMDQGHRPRPRRRHIAEPWPPWRHRRRTPHRRQRQAARPCDDDVPDLSVRNGGGLSESRADRFEFALGIGEIVEAPVRFRVPIAAVAAVAFDLMQAGMKPAVERIGFITLSDGMRAVPIASERQIDALLQVLRACHSFHPLARSSQAGQVPHP